MPCPSCGQWCELLGGCTRMYARRSQPSCDTRSSRTRLEKLYPRKVEASGISRAGAHYVLRSRCSNESTCRAKRRTRSSRVAVPVVAINARSSHLWSISATLYFIRCFVTALHNDPDSNWLHGHLAWWKRERPCRDAHSNKQLGWTDVLLKRLDDELCAQPHHGNC